MNVSFFVFSRKLGNSHRHCRNIFSMFLCHAGNVNERNSSIDLRIKFYKDNKFRKLIQFIPPLCCANLEVKKIKRDMYCNIG